MDPLNGIAMPTPSSPLLPDERPAAETARLANRFAGRFAPETVLDVLADSHTRLTEHARVGPHPVVPAERLDALAEAGVDLADAYLKPLTEEVVQASDYIITMGCGDACPYFPGKTYLDWQLEDPAGQGVEAVRPIRDEIKGLIEGLITEIDAKSKA
ncbi:phosphotyrosine protein phosphatase [Streptomyces erythrochromogenes]|uniref:Phosphotyrosine protein phosphatase n=1 Tax=Streptomyces erythrochromogenes TaxID=285574 RepID=A0ABZ1QLU9_9ACTN|nr:phosphotyrosine protein phosphatase [Streptomyces erythrochromogenes]